MELVGELHYQGEKTVRRVLMVNHHTTVVGGGELSMLQLMDGLKARSVVVSLAVPGEGELAERARAAGHPVHIVPMPKIGMASFTAFGKWRKLLKERDISIIHAHTPRATFYAGAGGRLASIPSIFHCRVAERDPRLDPILLRLVSRVVCNSRATANRFEAWPRVQPQVIYNGLDIEVMPAKLDKKGDAQKMNLLFVGRLTPEKQPEVAWEVFQGLAGRFPGLNLIYVGDNDLEDSSRTPAMKDAVGHSDIKARVIWAGVQQSVSPWFAMADVVIMPSKHEGFGRVLVEAMAHKVPVVAFRVGGIPEVVEDGREGILIEPYDVDAMREAVASLLQDNMMRWRMGEAGALKARKFSLAAHVEAVLGLYRDLEQRS